MIADFAINTPLRISILAISFFLSFFFRLSTIITQNRLFKILILISLQIESENDQ